MEDIEAVSAHLQQRITFEPDERPSQRGHGTESRYGSISCAPTSSVRSRTQFVTDIPIEYRTLSFEVSDSQTIGEIKNKSTEGRMETKEEKQEDKHYLANLKFHLLETHVACEQLHVTPGRGLSADDAAARLSCNGNSFLSCYENYLRKLLMYIFGGFCCVLYVGIIIFFICWRPLGDFNPAPYNLGLATLVLVVIFLQGFLSAFQDWSTTRTMIAILNLLPTEALVVRDGQMLKVSTTDLVVGDIVKVNIRNKVPADIRLFTTFGDIRFDRLVLIGESNKIEGAINVTDNNYLKARNLALMGTMVTNGSATGLVILTGGNIVMGRIAKATNTSPL